MIQGEKTEEQGIGSRLRRLREMYGLSQRELARRAGLTNGTVSLIEQGNVSPSIASLKKVLDGFPLSLADFFGNEIDPVEPAFYRAEELTEIAEGALSFRQVGHNLKHRALQLLHERYAPGADTGKAMLSHSGEESGIVIDGEIEITVGGHVQRLRAGDAYYFNSRLPHRFRNTGADPCIIVSACTPPTF